MMDWRNIIKGIGWSKSTWSQPLREFYKDNPDILFDHSLEVGASECGTLAPFLQKISRKITIGYYQCDVKMLNKKLSNLGVKSKAEYVDITKINGEYDLIIAKSVLGGIFRSHKSTIDDVDELIGSILNKNIKEGGMLLLLDNGNSFFEGALSNLGARKNNWRFFLKKDFQNYYKQYSFGFLSCFSLENRYSFFGKIFDYALYVADLLLTKMTNSPTVILTIYKK